MNDPITESFSPLIGLPCWGADKWQGSMLSFEFGEPHLIVREPMDTKSESPAIRARMARRNVRPVGAWHLWVYCCCWRIFSGAETVAHEEADDAVITAAMRELDGQKLIGVSLETMQRKTTFAFDLGGTLATWPYDTDNDEQWYLSMPDRRVLSYRTDGCYSLGASTLRPDEEVWQTLPREPQTYSIGVPSDPQASGREH